MTDRDQLAEVLAAAQSVADRLSMAGQFADAMAVVGAVQALRAMNTMLHPPPPAVPPEGPPAGEAP